LGRKRGGKFWVGHWRGHELVRLCGSRVYLSIHGGVPIRVVEDDCVGARQVHPYPSRASRQYEDEDLRVAVETLHQNLTLLRLR
jgi:hypothetical protein